MPQIYNYLIDIPLLFTFFDVANSTLERKATTAQVLRICMQRYANFYADTYVAVCLQI